MTTRHSLIASAVLALLLAMTPSPVSFGNVPPSITAEDPDGGPPGDHFTDLTLVPGDSVSSTIVVSQNTGSTVRTGVRFTTVAESQPLYAQAELTIEGLGEEITAPLGQILESDSPIWLGQLPSGQTADLTFTVHLPREADNGTKRERTTFRIVVTAQGDVPDTTPSPDPTPRETDDPAPDPSEEPEPDPGPDEDLPRTGTEVVLLLLTAVGLAGVGVLVMRASRRNSVEDLTL